MKTQDGLLDELINADCHINSEGLELIEQYASDMACIFMHKSIETGRVVPSGNMTWKWIYDCFKDFKQLQCMQ